MRIRSKIITSILFVTLITSLSIGVSVYYSIQKNVRQNLLSRMQSNTGSEAQIITDLIFSGDKDGIINLIFNERYSRKDMAYMIVLDENTNLVASTVLDGKPDQYIVKSNISTKIPIVSKIIGKHGEGIYNVVWPLEYNRGVLIVGYFDSEINAAISSAVLLMAIIILVITFFSLLASYIISLFIFKPLLELINISQEVGRGNFKIRAKSKSDDEIGYFAKVFNEMLDSVNNYQKNELSIEKKKYQDLVENSPLSIQIFDKNEKIEFMNRGGRLEHGLADDADISNWNWFETIEQNFVGEVKKCLQNAYEGKSSKMDIKHKSDSSNRGWCSVIFNPILDESGNVQKVLVLSNDITQMKSAETTAERNYQMFKTLIDSLPFCVKWYDGDGKLVSINKHGKDEHFLIDKTDDEIRNTVFKSNVIEEHRDRVKEGMDSAKRGIQKTFEIRHIEGTAKSDWVSNTFVPIQDAGGKVTYILMISREITEEKKLEEERKINLEKAEEVKMALYNILEDAKESERVLKIEKDRSSAIISSMGECLVVISNDFKIKLLNQKACEVLGISREEAEGQDFRKLVLLFNKDKKELTNDRPLETIFVKKESVILDFEDDLYYRCVKNDRVFPIAGVITPLLEKDSNMAVIVFQDVSKLKELDEAKSSFISVASHQLRTPLTSIRWYVEMLASNEAKNLDDEQKDFVERTYHNVLKLSETINLLLTLARAESGKTKQELVDMNFEGLVREVLREQDPAIKQKQLTATVVNHDDRMLEVKSDPVMLRQIIGNLISNSVRYTDKSGRIEVEISKVGNEVVCSVKDDGIGVPETEKAKIFDKFYRATNAVSKVPDGSGLGLSLVKQLVSMFGGKISFESPIAWPKGKNKTEKKGSRFTFTIPIK